jgi:hypothetical protein
MIERHHQAPACVYGLADSLDGILASCEDLQSTMVELARFPALELAAIKHVLQARRYIRELDPWQPQIVDMCAHFLMGTGAIASCHLADEIPERADTAVSLPLADHDLIGGHVPLSALAHLAGTLLDVLEAQFALYDDDAFDTESSPLPRTTATADHHQQSRSVVSLLLPQLSQLKHLWSSREREPAGDHRKH